MRFVVFLMTGCALAQAQAPAPPAEAAAAQPAPALAVPLEIAPLRPPDLGSLYASPRDAARHRFQATLAELESKRDAQAGIRGFADALAIDRTYAAAAFNLGVLCAIAEKWDDAVAALEEASKLDPAALGGQAGPQLERLRLIASLEKSDGGKLKRRYDEALLPVLDKLPSLPAAAAMAALAEVGRIDPKRWEAPGLLASLSGDGHGYDAAARFLEIAAANALDPAVRASLEKAQRAADRELRYAAARAAAEAASDRGEHAKAAELFEAAWTAIPARSGVGMEAASERLLLDDSAGAAALLLRLRDSGDKNLGGVAAAMLKQLEGIEPAAKAGAGDAAQFFKDPGPAEPVRIASLAPPVDRKPMEVLARPLPRLVQDPEPVVLLSSLSADPAEAAQAAALPVLQPPAIPGQHPWREVVAAWERGAAPPPPVAPGAQAERQTADLAGAARSPRVLQVSSEPAGARVFVPERPDAVCQTPCDIRVGSIAYSLRLSLAGYRDEQRSGRIAGKSEQLAIALAVLRGSVIVETPAPAALKINGAAAGVSAPIELSLVPGLYRIAADFGSSVREQMVTVRPGARLRLRLRP